MVHRVSSWLRALAVLPAMYLAPEASDAPPVLLVVASGSDFTVVERARSAIPATVRSLLVGESERIALQGGLEILVDRTFATAPPADVVVLVGDDPGRGVEDFLLGRRASARAILVPSGLPIAKRLKEDGGGKALILVGGLGSIPALLDAFGPRASSGAIKVAAESGATPVLATRTPPAPPTPPTPPTVTPTRAGRKGGVFDRYFSSGSRASRLSPTPH